MPKLRQRLAENRTALLLLAERHKLGQIRVFGSHAKQADEPNDIDLLVRPLPGCTLIEFIAFWQDAEDLLGCKVDVVAEGGISPRLEAGILAEATAL